LVSGQPTFKAATQAASAVGHSRAGPGSKDLAILTGHMEPPGASGGASVNINLAAMIERLDAEERAALPPAPRPS
jgi:hypothetical protein